MFILLDQVCPLPLDGAAGVAQSQVWLQRCKFQQGKRYIVKAPSGTGKSTFLHLLYGLRNDYRGKISLGDRDVSGFSVNDWAEVRKNRLSIVFQDLRLFPQLTALENILIKNDLIGHKTREEIEQMAAQLGIVEVLEQLAPTLSYGQQQRVGLVRALCQPFDFLLLDEPFSHLDKHNIQQARKLILRELKANQAGLILVSLGGGYGFEVDHSLKL